MFTPCTSVCIGLARTMYIRYIYGIFGREIAKITAKIRSYTVYIYGSGPPYVCTIQIPAKTAVHTSYIYGQL